MFVLLVYRPQLAQDDDTFAGIEVLHISTSEDECNKVISKVQREAGSLGYQFHIDEV